MLNKNQFSILYELSKKTSSTFSQEQLAKKTGIPLKSIDSCYKELIDKGCINNNQITSKGLSELEPYKVKNAIIMAAGMSSRFAPLSYENPKGLLKIKGEVLIEREIEQLLEAGITDITLVIGYMKEKFFYLEEKYGVKIIINEDYYRYNNTSTLIRVADRLSNTYICSSDNYFIDNVFEPYVYQSYYAAVFTPETTEEYCISFNSHDLITQITIGGENSWYMLGHVYFSADFSQKFVAILKEEYKRQTTKEHLWEDMYIRHIKELDLYIRKYDADKILEFDSLEDLRSFDEHYINNTDSAILKNIGSVLHCEDKDITDIVCIKAGLTNKSFYFTCNGKKYVYRHPGIGTDSYINRKGEAFSMSKASSLGLDNTFIYMDEREGWKLSYYIENVHTLNYHNQKEVEQALKMMRTLHDANIKSDYDFNIWKATLDFINKISEKGRNDFVDFHILFDTMTKVYNATESDHIEKRLCHCDCYDPNFLIDDQSNMYLIDWEYSGNDDPANDLGTFICCSDYTYEEALNVIQQYLTHEPSLKELRHYLGYVAISSYYWFVWAIYQESVGNTVGEYLYIWYKNSKFYAKKALELYEIND